MLLYNYNKKEREDQEMKKRIIKKYRLKESVKGGICFLVLGALIITFLFIQAERVERIENTGDTENKIVQVNFTR